MRSNTQVTYYERASRVYAGQLARKSGTPSHDFVSAYLSDRGITLDIARRYRLGFVANPIPGDERFQGGIAIPYLPPRTVRTGTVAAIKFRLFGNGRKYDHHKGEAARLYNTQAYFTAGEAIGLAEGEIDAIAATEHLDLPTIGIPGATQWKEHWRPVFRDFTTVFVFGDGDGPGREFAGEMAERIGWRARVVPVPDGEDIASLAAKNKLEAIRKVITTSKEDEQ